MNDLKKVLEAEQYSEPTVFFAAANAVGKVVKRLPSRMPVTLDVNITGTATVKVYGGNLTDDPASTLWGSAVRTITASEKVVFENEPWVYWMVEVSAYTSGTVSVAAGV
jgi:hypothetical protein